jgi:hypothetical protein
MSSAIIIDMLQNDAKFMSFFPTYLIKAMDGDFISYIDSTEYGLKGCGHIENTRRMLLNLRSTNYAGMRQSFDDEWNSFDSDTRDSYKPLNTVDPEERKRIYTEFRNSHFLICTYPESKLWNKTSEGIYRFF